MTRKTAGIGDGVRNAFEISAAKGLTLGSNASYLAFSGILPLTLPEGTRALILPDVHIPAHHRRLLHAVLRFGFHYKPDLVIAIGDWADVFALSRHPKGLGVRPVSFMDEMEESRRVWDDVMEYTGAQHGFIILGNHEDRINRFLQELAPQIAGVLGTNREPVMNFHQLMGFDRDDNVTLVYGHEMRGGFEGGLVINDDFNLHHGVLVKPTPGGSPLGDMDKWQWSIGHGHTHRAGLVARESGKRVLRGYEFGHLTNMDHAYMAYAKKAFPNWSPGFAVMQIHNGKAHVQPMPIMPIDNKLSFVYDGTVYSESDR